MTPTPTPAPRPGRAAALLALAALAGCAGLAGCTLARSDLPPGVPPNPFASNYPSAPPPAGARRTDGSGALLPPGRIPD